MEHLTQLVLGLFFPLPLLFSRRSPWFGERNPPVAERKAKKTRPCGAASFSMFARRFLVNFFNILKKGTLVLYPRSFGQAFRKCVPLKEGFVTHLPRG